MPNFVRACGEPLLLYDFFSIFSCLRRTYSIVILWQCFSVCNFSSICYVHTANLFLFDFISFLTACGRVCSYGDFGSIFFVLWRIVLSSILLDFLRVWIGPVLLWFDLNILHIRWFCKIVIVYFFSYLRGILAIMSLAFYVLAADLYY